MISLGAVALGLVSFVLPACAQQYAAPIPFRLLSDPAYLPMQDQWYGLSAFDASDRSADVYDSANTKTATRRGWENEIVQELGYGITNDLAIHVQDSYVPYDKTKTEFTAGGYSDSNNTGFRDPEIGLTWRALDQVNQPVSVDVIANYRMNVIDARPDDVAQGGQSGQFGLAVSKVMPMFTIYGQALAEWYGTQSQSGANFVRQASYWDYLLNLQTQTRITRRFSFNAGVGYVFANSAQIQNFGTGVTHITDPGNGLKLDAALNYAVMPDVVVSLTYDYARDNTGKELFVVPALDTLSRNHDENQIGVKFAYDTP
jgi:hypothetical protein